MQELQYFAPTTVEDACALLSRHGGRLLAGGTDLIAQMREGRRAVTHVVDLKQIPELSRISRNNDGSWQIGAAATIGDLARHEQFADEHAALLAAAQLIGSLQIQNRASLGGNICNAAPSADAVPLLISIGAEAEIVGSNGRRRVPVAAIATGPGRTSLAGSEILISVLLPALRPRSAGAYLRFTPRREMDIAIAGAAVALRLDAAGAIADARITLASVAPVPLVAGEAQRHLLGQRPSLKLFASAAEIAGREARPISDARGSADYRRDLVGVLTRRTLQQCATDLGCDLS